MPYKDPAKRREYHRQYKRTQRAGFDQGFVKPLLPLTFRLQTAQDILALLAEQVGAVRAAKAGALEKARCIGYLCGVGLRAVEVAEVESRLTAMEEMLEQRKGWTA